MSGTRRDFLHALGLAGLTGCVGRPRDQLIPFVRQPEYALPGQPIHYATAAAFGGRGIGLLVESHDGRPIKIEGHPDHPMSKGGTTAIQQAWIADLYSPRRLREPLQREGGRLQPAPWLAAERALAEQIDRLQQSGGKGLFVLAEPLPSPTLLDLRQRWTARYPLGTWLDYDGLGNDSQRAGMLAAFGQPLLPRWHLDRARCVVSLDCDFLGTEGDVAIQSREWATARSITSPRSRPARLYMIEGICSITGNRADHRLRVRPSQVEGAAWALVRRLAALDFIFPPDVVPTAERLATDVDPVWLHTVANDLKKHRGTALVVVGRRQPPVLHALAASINARLGCQGRTVVYCPDVRRPADAPGDLESIEAMTERLKEGTVDTLVLLGGNPVYSAPGALGFGAALAKAQTVIAHAAELDETARAAHWVLPRAHPLETWGDVFCIDGTVSIQQPLIEPLHGAWSEIELMARFVAEPGDATPEGGELVRGYWRGRDGPRFEKAWRRALHRGTRAQREFGLVPAYRGPQGLGRLAENLAPPPELEPGTLELVFALDHYLLDGRGASNPILQELPDPITGLCWDNAALISPATAVALDLRHGDAVTLAVGDRALAAFTWVVPGIADETVVVGRGYGRRVADAEPVGFDIGPLRTVQHAETAPGARLTRAGGGRALALLARGRGLGAADAVRETTLGAYRRSPDAIARAGQPVPPSGPRFEYERGYQWGMTIDLARCTGCAACLAACMVENNVPPLGRQAVLEGRDLHWLRLDRHPGGSPAEPRVVHQPVPCMQCENAPCERACPVGATMHSPEGLNDQIYARCVGARDCATHCPFGVRRYNWPGSNIQADDPLRRMGDNPDVSVRSAGVVEKCTYCVQRINRGKRRVRAARTGAEARAALAAVQPACGQACPAGAIAFGDLLSPSSPVSKARESGRHYSVLPGSGLMPRTTYLAGLWNPEPNLVAHAKPKPSSEPKPPEPAAPETPK